MRSAPDSVQCFQSDMADKQNGKKNKNRNKVFSTLEVFQVFSRCDPGKNEWTGLINMLKEIRERQTLNFFLNSFSSFSIFFCFFGSISSALLLPFKVGRLECKTIK